MFSGQQLFLNLLFHSQFIQSNQNFSFFIGCLSYSSTWLAIVVLCSNLPCEINSMPFVRFHWSSCMYDPWAEKVTGVQDKDFSKTTEEIKASSYKATQLKGHYPDNAHA